MTWQELEPDTKAAPPKAPVRVGLFKPRGARARMVVLVETVILEGLGGRAMRYRVQAGNGTEGHQIRIVQDDAGRFEAANCGRAEAGKRTTYQRIRLPKMDRFPDQTMPMEKADFSVDKQARALTIDLPAWAWHRRPRAA